MQLVKSGGYVILGLYNHIGRLRTDLHVLKGPIEGLAELALSMVKCPLAFALDV